MNPFSHHLLFTKGILATATASWSTVAEMRGRSLASATPLSGVPWFSRTLLALAKQCLAPLATALQNAGAKFSPQLPLVVICTSLSGLSSCDKKPTDPPQAAKPATEALQPSWRDWITNSTDKAWLKQQWSDASDAAKTAKGSLDALNIGEVQKQVSEFAKALEAQDFTKMENMAGELAKHLSIEKLEQGVRFVILQRQKGGEAALKAIDDYAARTDLSDLEKAAAQNLRKSAALLQRDDFRGWVYLSIFFACECKLGAHRGGLLAIPIISILFPDYLEKHGDKP